MNLLFYFFANYQTGYGHYFRSSALAHAALERGHRVTIAGDKRVDNIAYIPTAYDLRQSFEIAYNWIKPDWVIVDLPHVPPVWVREIAGDSLVCVLNGIGYNQNDGADLRVIQGLANVNLPGPQDKVPTLSGVEYVILRPEIEQHQRECRLPLTFVWGGALDHMQLLTRYSLTCLNDQSILVTTELTNPPHVISPNHNLIRTNNDAFLHWLSVCQRSVMAMGMSVWEAVALNVPTYVFSYSDLHYCFARGMAEVGLIKAWPGVGLPSGVKIKEFISEPFEITGPRPDGLGAVRVLEAMEDYD